MSHYAWHNVTESSRITTRHVWTEFVGILNTYWLLYTFIIIFNSYRIFISTNSHYILAFRRTSLTFSFLGMYLQ